MLAARRAHALEASGEGVAAPGAGQALAIEHLFQAEHGVITDVTPPAKRADGMGKIGAALGVAFVLGPAMGGILADFGPQLPFYAVSAIAATALGLTAPEGREPALQGSTTPRP